MNLLKSIPFMFFLLYFSFSAAEYSDGSWDYKLPDEIGNLFKTKDKTDRQYGKAGQLLKDETYSYIYDEVGNLIEKESTSERWRYQWSQRGMLKKVIRPDRKHIDFTYDALGRQLTKTFKDETTHFVWNGNTPLHEWTSTIDETIAIVNEKGERELKIPENLTTWIFEDGTFIPMAKLQDGKSYSIITDHLGTPTEAYDEGGEKIWSRQLNIYGESRKETGFENFIPYLYQGQSLDVETELAYNGYRYYSPKTGTYLSQDPIRYFGSLNLYGYVSDCNVFVDPYGWEDIWYRALSGDDMSSLEVGGNIMPKDPGASNSALSHVYNGSTDGYGDQYVSLTKDKGFTERWARKSGTDVVEIDLDKVSNTKLDLTTGSGRVTHLGDAGAAGASDELKKANKWAKGAEELLVEGEIDISAIKSQKKTPCN